MTKLRFEMYCQYRHILMHIQGDSDREIARSKTMGRKKIAQVREIAIARSWLSPDFTLPDDAALALTLVRKEPLPSTSISTLEPWRAQSANWYPAGTTIHAPLRRRINQRDWGGAAVEGRRWVYVGGKGLPVLVARRDAESSLLAERSCINAS